MRWWHTPPQASRSGASEEDCGHVIVPKSHVVICGYLSQKQLELFQKDLKTWDIRRETQLLLIQVLKMITENLQKDFLSCLLL